MRDESGSETCITKSQLDSLLSGAVASRGNGSESDTVDSSEPINPAPESDTSTTTKPIGDTEAPYITINGNNPAEISVGTTYADLGATVTDNVDNNLGIHTFVDGVEMTVVQIDTSVAGSYSIIYRATDNAGNVGEAERIVHVTDDTLSSLPSDPDLTSTPKPEPAPAPETETVDISAEPEPPVSSEVAEEPVSEPTP